MGETTSQAAPPGTFSTAGRIKYADPRDLPSFPSSGLPSDGAAASAAASLGWANQKPVELWKPDKTSSASAAAALAKDYKMSPAWEPDTNSAGHKAALLAVGSAGAALKQASPRSQHENWGNSAATQAFNASRPATLHKQSASVHGSSAATQAFNMSRPTSTQQSSSAAGASAATQAFNASRALSIKQSNNTPSPVQGDRSLAAAKGAMRPRATSTPSTTRARDSYALDTSAASSAINGAALAHRASMMKTPPPDAGAVSVTTMTRNMFTYNPPVKPETDEKEYNERLHQSAVDMAKKMYSMQKKSEEARERGEGADSSQGTYLNLQDAAYKQAQDRLSKLHDEHQQSREYQAYYGNAPSHRRRFSMVNKLHRRSSSDSDMMVNDRERSETIRQQMSMFSDKLSEVDQKKRSKDREALLAAAQRNVKARLQGMDQKVYRETGKATPSMVNDWDLKAQQAAQARHETRTENRGKIDIGGGKFMDPEEIDAIAAKRLQPVLDDINEKAEAEHARQTVLRLEEEARRAEQEREKNRERELKEDKKKAKDLEKQEEKAKKQQERDEEKAKKDEEKAAKAEEKRLAKEEKRKSKQSAKSEPIAAVDATHEDENDDDDDDDAAILADSPVRPTIETGAETADAETPKSPDDSESATSPTSKSKVRGWLKNRFSRGKSVSENEGGKRRSFLGGRALRKSEAEERPSMDNRATSMRDVAMAGKNEDSRGVSPVSSDSDEIEEGGPSSRGLSILPPKPLEDPVARTSSSPTRDSRFREMMDR